MKLEEYEFEEVGGWKKYDRVKSGINFHISKFENERVIYAFVVEDKVRYIGICEKDSTILRERLKRYKSLAGAGTNKRIAGEIKKCLKKGMIVKIYALKPKSGCKYKDLEIDLVKGLENPLIKKFGPEWNIL